MNIDAYYGAYGGSGANALYGGYGQSIFGGLWNNNSDSLNGLYGVLSSGRSSYYKPSVTSYRTSDPVREAGRSLLNAAHNLNSKNAKSVFQSYKAASSDNKVASAAVDNARANGVKPDSFELRVKQTALGQKNAGFAVKASEKKQAAGIYGFSIESGGKKNFFYIDVNSRDDNASIQNKMALAINKKNIGVTASVTKDSKQGTSMLTLASDKTGTNQEFAVQDTTGSLAADMGINNITQEARNAVYSVDGGMDKVSQSNEITAAKGVTVVLKDEGKTTVSFDADKDAMVSSVMDWADSINSALTSVKASDGDGSARLIRDLASMTKSYAASLKRVGISVAANGKLSVDEKKLNEAAEDGNLQRLFGDNSYGPRQRTERIAQNASQTEYYRDAQVSKSASIQDYLSSFYGGSSLMDLLC